MMLCNSTAHRRPGGLVLECAIVYPVTFLLLLGMIIAGLGVFRYQQVADIAREAARYASVHGRLYQQSTGKPAATDSDVYNKSILPWANAFATLDTTKLRYQVTWSPDNQPGSMVTVSLTYHWIPEAFLPEMDLSTTSKAVVTY
jgi:Flp pilus assembly protein TadG